MKVNVCGVHRHLPSPTQGIITIITCSNEKHPSDLHRREALAIAVDFNNIKVLL